MNNLNEDGLPIRSGRYNGDEGDQGDSEGLRIYDAWYQHRNAEHIPKSRIAVPLGKAFYQIHDFYQFLLKREAVWKNLAWIPFAHEILLNNYSNNKF